MMTAQASRYYRRGLKRSRSCQLHQLKWREESERPLSLYWHCQKICDWTSLDPEQIPLLYEKWVGAMQPKKSEVDCQGGFHQSLLVHSNQTQHPMQARQKFAAEGLAKSFSSTVQSIADVRDERRKSWGSPDLHR